LRVLIANHRYFVASGIERYLFNLSAQLTGAGHSVVPFAIDYAQNEPSEYSRYFVSPIGRRDQVYFSEHRNDVANWPKSFSRLFYSGEVERAARRIVTETQPDIAYVLYYMRKLSPALLVGLKQPGIPLVVRLSDYGMFCSERHCLRDNTACTECKSGRLLPSVVNRCVHGSIVVSALHAMATAFHRWKGYFDLIDAFVVTNPFMRDMMLEAGFAPQRIVCIPTFTDTNAFSPAPADVVVADPRAASAAAPRDVVYVGRIDPPKGIEVLIEAIALLRERFGAAAPRLRIVGEGHDLAYRAKLDALIAERGLDERVVFTGQAARDQVIATLRGALCSVLPAVWFENLPNTLIESLACGTPLVASNIGSLARTLTDEQNALLFRPRDARDLAAKIGRIIAEPGLAAKLSATGRETALSTYSPAAHLEKLTGLFDQLRLRRTVAAPLPANSDARMAGGIR
jgi:glycosyltransferase involved in cell wall biosynthesis